MANSNSLYYSCVSHDSQQSYSSRNSFSFVNEKPNFSKNMEKLGFSVNEYDPSGFLISKSVLSESKSEPELTPAFALGLSPPQSKNSFPHSAVTPSEVHKTVEDASLKAKQCGISMAKCAFFARSLSLISTGAMLVVAALVTGMTGGAGIPLLILASASFAIAVGDVACAAYDWYSKVHGCNGLAMGSDSLGNSLYKLCKLCNASDQKALKVAFWGALFARSSVTIAGAIMGGFLPVSTPATLQQVMPYVSIVKSVVDVGAVLFNGAVMRHGIDRAIHNTALQRAEGKKAIYNMLLIGRGGDNNYARSRFSRE